jgi:hypothetical protein
VCSTFVYLDDSAARLPSLITTTTTTTTEVVDSKSIVASCLPVHVESMSNEKSPSKMPVIKPTTSQMNGHCSTDNMLMEEMLLEEEEEHRAHVKSIDLDSLTIPDNSTDKSHQKDDTTETKTTTTAAAVLSVPCLTPSPTKKPYTLYKVPHTNHTTPPSSSRQKKSIKKVDTSSSTRMYSKF